MILLEALSEVQVAARTKEAKAAREEAKGLPPGFRWASAPGFRPLFSPQAEALQAELQLAQNWTAQELPGRARPTAGCRMHYGITLFGCDALGIGLGLQERELLSALRSGARGHH